MRSNQLRYLAIAKAGAKIEFFFNLKVMIKKL